MNFPLLSGEEDWMVVGDINVPKAFVAIASIFHVLKHIVRYEGGGLTKEKKLTDGDMVGKVAMGFSSLSGGQTNVREPGEKGHFLIRNDKVTIILNAVVENSDLSKDWVDYLEKAAKDNAFAEFDRQIVQKSPFKMELKEGRPYLIKNAEVPLEPLGSVLENLARVWYASVKGRGYMRPDTEAISRANIELT